MTALSISRLWVFCSCLGRNTFSTSHGGKGQCPRIQGFVLSTQWINECHWQEIGTRIPEFQGVASVEVPLYKNGEPKVNANYKGITLKLPLCSLVLKWNWDWRAFRCVRNVVTVGWTEDWAESQSFWFAGQFTHSHELWVLPGRYSGYVPPGRV